MNPIKVEVYFCRIEYQVRCMLRIPSHVEWKIVAERQQVNGKKVPERTPLHPHLRVSPKKKVWFFQSQYNLDLFIIVDDESILFPLTFFFNGASDV